MQDFFNPTAKKSTKPKSATQKAAVPWVEKYRPQKLSDVANREDVSTILQKCIDKGEIPNLLFYGPPGTGKTSTILAMAHQLFGSSFKERVLELNASDERGIQVIREKVKKFSQYSVKQSPDMPPFKLIVLDEADAMTAPAQAALRRIMETELRTTRFCLTCNYITRIIDPITSRCSKFHFKPLNYSDCVTRLKHIAEQEKLIVTNQTLEHLVSLSQGDMRCAIMLLQSAALLGNPLDSEPAHLEVTVDILDEVASVIPEGVSQNIFKLAKSKNMDKVTNAIKELMLEGYSGQQLIFQLQELVVKDGALSDLKKAQILSCLAISDARMLEGADVYIQLLNVGASLVSHS